MAKIQREGEIPEEYLSNFEKEMVETTDGKETNRWTEYSKGYVPYGTDTEELDVDAVSNKTGWFRSKDDLSGETLSGEYTAFTRGAGKAKAAADVQHKIMSACKSGDSDACLLIQATMMGYSPSKQAAKEQMRDIPMQKRKGFAQGGLMDNSARMWKMEAQYPEFQKGIANRLTKERVPTQPIEEQYMYSPTQQGYPPGYAEGGSVYDETGSMLAPGVPLDFEADVPMDMPMDTDSPMDMAIEEVSELGLSPEETEVLSQAMSDYPELEEILNKVGSAMGSEFTGDGSVDGPGTETSDSIPARLSDGEFVMTAKAVKQLGVDKLRKMMSKAELDYDEASNKQEYQQMGEVGFAKGGFFTRPGYEEGGMTSEGAMTSEEEWKDYSKWNKKMSDNYNEKRSFFGDLGTAIMKGLENVVGKGFDSVMDLIEKDPGTIDPDTEEAYETEDYKQHQKNLQDLGI